MVPYFFLLLCWPTLPLQGKGLLHFGLTRTTKNDELETSRGESTFLFITNCCHYCVKSLAAARGRAVKFDPSNRPEADNLRVRLIMCCSPSRADAVHSQQSVRSCKTYLKTQTNKHLSELSCFCRPEKKKTTQELFFSLCSDSNWLRLSCVTGLEILDPEEVEYIRSNATATVGGSVTLDCGSTVPTIFIWGFTKPGTENNVAVAYNYGQGPKLQAQSGSLGRMQVLVNTSALVIEELQRDAEGMYTCQALYDTDEGARITFYFTRLDVEDDWWELSASSFQKCAAFMSASKDS